VPADRDRITDVVLTVKSPRSPVLENGGHGATAAADDSEVVRQEPSLPLSWTGLARLSGTPPRERREPVEGGRILCGGDLVGERVTATLRDDLLGDAGDVVDHLVGDLDGLTASLGDVPAARPDTWKVAG
jgi:hypothetical protein